MIYKLEVHGRRPTTLNQERKVNNWGARASDTKNRNFRLDISILLSLYLDLRPCCLLQDCLRPCSKQQLIPLRASKGPQVEKRCR